MFKTVTSIFAASLAVAVLGVTDAHATTFCVPNYFAGCANDGTNVAQANLETAMQSNATDGVADVIKVDGIELSDPDSFTPSGTDGLTIEGVGAATRLTSATTVNSYTINLGADARSITMRDLTVVIPDSIVGNGGAGVQVKGDTLENVDIEARNPGASPLTSWIGGGTFSGGRIYAAGNGSFGNGIRTDANATGTVTIEDAEVDHASATSISVTGPGTVNVRRSHLISGNQGGITVSNGTTNLENTVIEAASNTWGIYALANSANNATVNADHVTMVTGGGNASAFAVQVMAGKAGNASITATNSIARGFAANHVRSAPAASADGNANLTVRYSNVHPTALDSSTGDGTLTMADNIDADPQFVAPNLLQLNPASPSIDAGDPAAGGLTEDILKAPRPVDGNAVAGAVRDQGAYEYQPPAPLGDPPADPSDPADPTDPSDPTGDPVNQGQADTTAPDTIKGKGPRAKIRKKKAKFAFTSSEAGASFRCELDGTALPACTSPLKLKRLKRGTHVLTVAAADAAGNVDQTPASWKFKVKKRRR